jgi:hypothetical protein
VGEEIWDTAYWGSWGRSLGKQGKSREDLTFGVVRCRLLAANPSCCVLRLQGSASSSHLSELSAAIERLLIARVNVAALSLEP